MIKIETFAPQKTTPSPIKKRVLAFLIVFLGIITVVKSVVISTMPTEASDLSLENILQAVNRERELRNILTLNTDGRLAAAAQYKASDMINRNYFSHTDPEGNYIWGKIESLGYTPYSRLGENLAIEFYNTESLVDAWMNSPTHRANLLQEGFRDQGVGLSYGSTGQYHSAIANTFGALVYVKPTPPPPVVTPPLPTPAPSGIGTPTASVGAAPTPKPSPPPPAPLKKPAPAPLPPPPAPTPAPTPAPPPAPAVAPPSPVPNPLKPRQDLAYENPTVKTASIPTTTTSTQPSPTPTRPIYETSEPTINKEAGEIKKNIETNRYAMLVFGFVLLYVLGKDALKAYKDKLGFLDKKVNNIVLLIISLIVVAVMYWI